MHSQEGGDLRPGCGRVSKLGAREHVGPEYLLSGVALLLLTLEHWSLLLILFRASEPGGKNPGRVEGIWRDQELERKQRESLGQL